MIGYIPLPGSRKPEPDPGTRTCPGCGRESLHVWNAFTFAPGETGTELWWCMVCGHAEHIERKG